MSATRRGRSSQRGGTVAWLVLCGAAGAGLFASGALRGLLGAPEGGSPDPYQADFTAAAARSHVPERLLEAVASVESDFTPMARSSAGAEGIMQMLPATFARWEPHPLASPWDPTDEIPAAAAMLAADGAAGGDAAGITRALHADNPSWPDVRAVLARWHQLEGQR